MKTFSILKDYHEYPGLRHCKISEYSGEHFYHTKLNSAFKEAYAANEKLIVDLDFTGGYASSFLDEAFGNLVYDFELSNVKRIVEIVSNQEPEWKTMIEQETYIQWEARRKKNEAPIVTSEHEPWYRLVNGELVSKVWETPAK